MPNHTALIESTTKRLRVPVQVVDKLTAPQVYRYRCEPAQLTLANGNPGKLTWFSSLRNRATDLSVALGIDNIRVVVENGLWIEVPKAKPSIIKAESLNPPTGHLALPVVLGTSVTNQPVVFDLADCPHMMIAGTTGSGKSVCVDSIVSRLIDTRGADRLQLCLIDMNRNLTQYQVQHLLGQVAVDSESALSLLEFLVTEMNRRYVFIQSGKGSNMPRIVVVIDEFANLLISSKKETIRLFGMLAQGARRAGIHLIVSTQSPRRTTIGGLIDANFPTRVCFRTVDRTDSQIALGTIGAERLLGQGDGLVQLPDGTSTRFQGAIVSDITLSGIIDRNKRKTFSQPIKVVSHGPTQRSHKLVKGLAYAFLALLILAGIVAAFPILSRLAGPALIVILIVGCGGSFVKGFLGV